MLMCAGDQIRRNMGTAKYGPHCRLAGFNDKCPTIRTKMKMVMLRIEQAMLSLFFLLEEMFLRDSYCFPTDNVPVQS